MITDKRFYAYRKEVRRSDGDVWKNARDKATEIPKISNRYVVFDVETTGFGPQRGARVMEIGAVLIADGTLFPNFKA